MIGRRNKRGVSTVAAPEPTPTYTQDELRERRRSWRKVLYGKDFNLTAEVRTIVTPLAKQVAKLPRPDALQPEVDNVADAVHEVLSTCIGMLAESRLDPTAHARTVQAVRDLAARPQAPLITPEDLASGRWATKLTKYVAPQTADLAAFLGRAFPPDHPALSGLSASERITNALRILDTAARDLERRIPRVAEAQARPSLAEFNDAKRAQRDAERADKLLAKMKAGAR